MRGEIWLGGRDTELYLSPWHLQMEKARFLNISVPLWEKAQGGAAPLLGEAQWPFSIAIPKDVALDDPSHGRIKRTYALPQTFLERGAAVSVRYSIIARVGYKNMFRDVDAE